MANILLIIYAIVGIGTFLYWSIEGWISGNPIEITAKIIVGTVFGFTWPILLLAILIWFIVEIIVDFNKR